MGEMGKEIIFTSDKLHQYKIEGESENPHICIQEIYVSHPLGMHGDKIICLYYFLASDQQVAFSFFGIQKAQQRQLFITFSDPDTRFRNLKS